MDIITKNNIKIAVADPALKIKSSQDILDLMATVHYTHDASMVVLNKENLSESFFDLRTGFAGEVLQKFSNYHFKAAVVGDFSHYESNSLRDFIYECNRGNFIFFKSDKKSALEALIKAGATEE